MTRPKFRPCPSCQTPNQASRKTCCVCFGSLSTKQKLREKMMSLDSQWGQSVVKSRNVVRIIDSARIIVQKLEAVGYKPILFLGKKEKKDSNKWVADIITHLQPTPDTKMFLEKMRRAFEFILIKSQQLDSNFPIAEQPGSIGVEQPEQPGSSSVEQPESISVELPEQPGSISAELTENIGLEQPESISVEQPESLIKDSETVFILDLVSLSPQSLTSLSAPSSSTFTSVLPPHTSSCLSSSLQKRKKRTKTSTSSLPHSANSVPPPPCSQPAASSISESLNQEGPVVKKRIKGCRKCSRQKVFLFEKITGERTSEGKKELKVHWLPCTVCGRTWDDTWEPASEFQHFVPESPYPSQLSA